MKELKKNELMVLEGGFLPLAVIIGIGVFEIGCCIVALGMKARLNQEKPGPAPIYDAN
ncbi:MAG: class IIb bacteriocin, lactobin A/cerein 7B family [Prolixibacteraceae bacterium]